MSNLVGAVEEVDRNGMRQRVMIRILEENRKDFHPRRFCLSWSILQCPLQGALTIRSVFSHLSFSIRVAAEVESKVPQKFVVSRGKEGDGKGEKLPTLNKCERSSSSSGRR